MRAIAAPITVVAPNTFGVALPVVLQTTQGVSHDNVAIAIFDFASSRDGRGQSQGGPHPVRVGRTPPPEASAPQVQMGTALPRPEDRAPRRSPPTAIRNSRNRMSYGSTGP
jgi:hypothetical protein